MHRRCLLRPVAASCFPSAAFLSAGPRSTTSSATAATTAATSAIASIASNASAPAADSAARRRRKFWDDTGRLGKVSHSHRHFDQ